jgi:hypothetical protein
LRAGYNQLAIDQYIERVKTLIAASSLLFSLHGYGSLCSLNFENSEFDKEIKRLKKENKSYKEQLKTIKKKGLSKKEAKAVKARFNKPLLTNSEAELYLRNYLSYKIKANKIEMDHIQTHQVYESLMDQKARFINKLTKKYPKYTYRDHELNETLKAVSVIRKRVGTVKDYDFFLMIEYYFADKSSSLHRLSILEKALKDYKTSKFSYKSYKEPRVKCCVKSCKSCPYNRGLIKKHKSRT